MYSKNARNLEKRSFEFGLISSILVHSIIGILCYSGVIFGGAVLAPTKIYSVTVEGGQSLGGIAQVPKDDKKTPLAPPKKVQLIPEKVEQKSEQKVEEKKEELLKVEDAELSLQEKKVTPHPTYQPTIEPKTEPKASKPQKETKLEKKSEDLKSKDKPKTKDQTAAELNKQYQQAMQRYLGESSSAGGKGFGAAAIGGKGYGGGIVMPPEYFRYTDMLKSRVKEAWRWYDTSAPLVTVLVFDLSANGETSNFRVEKSSGNSEFDASVERAVRKASPFAPPPSSIYELHLKSVRLTFDPREL